MTDHRKRYDRTFKAKVVLESLKNQKTIAELASEYGIHPNQITQWRKQALEDLPGIFSSKQAKKEKAYEEEKAELYRQIGQLKVEVEWLKKSRGFFSPEEKGEYRHERSYCLHLPAMRAHQPQSVEPLLSIGTGLCVESLPHEAY